jgi:hypothetical protein
MESQNQAILSHLKTGKSITQLEALDMFGCMRLSGRIFDLKNNGWPIVCEKIRLDSGKFVGKYSLVQDKVWWPLSEQSK